MKVKDVVTKIQSNRIVVLKESSCDCVVELKSIDELSDIELDLKVDDYTDFWFINECEIFIKE